MLVIKEFERLLNKNLKHDVGFVKHIGREDKYFNYEIGLYPKSMKYSSNKNTDVKFGTLRIFEDGDRKLLAIEPAALHKNPFDSDKFEIYNLNKIVACKDDKAIQIILNYILNDSPSPINDTLYLFTNIVTKKSSEDDFYKEHHKYMERYIVKDTVVVPVVKYVLAKNE